MKFYRFIVAFPFLKDKKFKKLVVAFFEVPLFLYCFKFKF